MRFYNLHRQLTISIRLITHYASGICTIRNVITRKTKLIAIPPLPPFIPIIPTTDTVLNVNQKKKRKIHVYNSKKEDKIYIYIYYKSLNLALTNSTRFHRFTIDNFPSA